MEHKLDKCKKRNDNYKMKAHNARIPCTEQNSKLHATKNIQFIKLFPHNVFYFPIGPPHIVIHRPIMFNILILLATFSSNPT